MEVKLVEPNGKVSPVRVDSDSWEKAPRAILKGDRLYLKSFFNEGHYLYMEHLHVCEDMTLEEMLARD